MSDPVLADEKETQEAAALLTAMEQYQPIVRVRAPAAHVPVSPCPSTTPPNAHPTFSLSPSFSCTFP